MHNSLHHTPSRHKLQLGWQEFLCALHLTHFVTFNFNFHNHTSMKSAHRMLGEFGVRINRMLHGQNYHKKPAHLMTWFIVIPEHKDSNLHFHGILYTANIEGFNAAAEALWQKIVASGQLYFERKSYTADDKKNITKYITKCMTKYNSFDDAYFFGRKNMANTIAGKGTSL